MASDKPYHSRDRPFPKIKAMHVHVQNAISLNDEMQEYEDDLAEHRHYLNGVNAS
jgi:hypothetical protein